MSCKAIYLELVICINYFTICRTHGISLSCPVRRPITNVLLYSIVRYIHSIFSGFNQLMLRSLVRLAFFGLLRVSQGTSLSCPVRRQIINSTLSLVFFSRFDFLDQSSITMETTLYHIFLKSSTLLFKIFLVEVKRNILNTFVSFQLVSRRISRAKEKMNLKHRNVLCSKYRSMHLRKVFRDSPSRGVSDFFSHT